MPKVIMYTTNYCGYCRAAKQYLKANKGIEVEEIDVTNDMDTRRRLLEETGQRTVPQIYVNDTHVGGYTDMVALDRTGKLDDLLKNE